MVARNPETGELFVYIDDDLADYRPNRYRFTVAEELAHIVIHRWQIDAVTTPEDFRELMALQIGEQMERNAKRFAAAVLMPHLCVDRMARQMYPRLVERVGFTNPDVVKKYLAAWLAKQFEVSVESMTYRLREWPVRIMDRIDEAMRNRFDQLD
jgi:Zn-dependent peptidase ImmA (M78 family)